MSEHVQISKRLVVINSFSAVLSRVLNLTVIVWLAQYLVRRLIDLHPRCSLYA